MYVYVYAYAYVDDLFCFGPRIRKHRRTRPHFAEGLRYPDGLGDKARASSPRWHGRLRRYALLWLSVRSQLDPSNVVKSGTARPVILFFVSEQGAFAVIGA